MLQFGSAGDPVHVIVEVLSIGVVVWGVLHQDRKERKKEAVTAEEKRKRELEELEKIQDQRHAENREDMSDIKTQLEYHPPHLHTEEDGPLTARGIRYRPTNNRERER